MKILINTLKYNIHSDIMVRGVINNMDFVPFATFKRTEKS